MERQLQKKTYLNKIMENNLKISYQNFSKLFWEIIFINGAFIIDDIKIEIHKQNNYFESLRKLANYNTGSISFASSVCLGLISYYFKPKIICEIGTFIGRSTFSVGFGAQINENFSTEIHTCDYSNNLKLDFSNYGFNILQYPKQSSTEMLTILYQKNIIPDAYLFDGRIQSEDIKILDKLKADKKIIILDDFEGFEKGVMNSLNLTQYFKNNFSVIYPPAQSFLKEFGLIDISTAAVLIPIERIQLVNQG